MVMAIGFVHRVHFLQQHVGYIAATLFMFLYMCYKDSLSGIVGSVSSYTYTRWSVFCVGKIFLLNAVMQFFFHPVNKGETEGYVELTAEEIAVKRSLHFSFCSAVFFPVLPVLLAFSRHLNFQDILLVWVALTHRAKVVSHVQYFFFIPPPSLDLQMNRSSLYIPPFMPPSLVSHTYFVLYLKLLYSRLKGWSTQRKKYGECFWARLPAGTDESLGRIGNQMSGCKLLKWNLKKTLPTITLCYSSYSTDDVVFPSTPSHYAWQHFTLQPY